MTAPSVVAKPAPWPAFESVEFWAGANEHKLKIQRCSETLNYIYPPDTVSPWTRRETLEYVEVSGRATLYSYAGLSQAFHAGFADHLPYVIALVELEEQPGLRMITNIVGTPLEELSIGLPLIVDFDDRGEQTVPVFRVSKEL
ncbi:hypothetical protein GIY30_22730 [Gordonia sp. HNM0687]|uniref:ChsH2 C-terminal OB-fold domain-containing protein n=1 Tax=Gordonia mangrovi TaxID=2665643 RepID=A0A6L7GW10_9ACTN|nr:OB-fold domain-containing protein [Gordonia mangrovi]MXP24156.1 hypothetical protein [Gordonia mangrovi]UVF76955.1 OB-fold domain-containing protein [Gordonia mangrovi]